MNADLEDSQDEYQFDLEDAEEIELLTYECQTLGYHIPLECWSEIREFAVPKLLKKEYTYVKLIKRVKPYTMELRLHEHYFIDLSKQFPTIPLFSPAHERVAFGYFSALLFRKQSKSMEQKSKKEQERNLVKELKTENLQNIQVLLDKNGREIQIDNDDIYGDDEDSNDMDVYIRKKGKGGDSSKRFKSRKASIRVR